jgi:chromosome segregation ATPase
MIEEPQMGVLGESTQRLRTEELLFKLKVRFGSLLSEAAATEEEVARFGQLTKVDELILFVTDRIRRALSDASSLANNSSSSNHKDKEAVEQSKAELEQTRVKLLEREASEKGLKGRLKEAHTELKELYDRVNVKEKEYSQRTTELYQLRVQMKEQEKASDAMRTRLQAAEKDRN